MFQPPKRPRPEKEDCEIEIKNTRNGGEKIRIGKNCTRDQVRMVQERTGINDVEIGD